MTDTLEICVDSPDDLAIAISANVDRIELCSALDLGGLTPTPGLIALAKNSAVPIYAMIRPRGGNFIYTEAELCSMELDIAAMRAAGFAGVVFGAAKNDQTLDIVVLKRLCVAAKGMRMTLHRVVDEMSSPRDAVDTAIDLGFDRILTSGGASTAVEGKNEISAMIELAAGKIDILAGSGVSFENISVLRAVGVSSFHASCRVKNSEDQNPSLDVGVLSKTLKAILRTV